MQTLTSLPAADTETPVPVLPGPASAPAPRDVQKELRRFHLGNGDETTAWIDLDLLPALLHPFRDRGRIRTDYPVVLLPGTAGEGPRGLTVAEWLEGLLPAESPRALSDNLLRLEGWVRDLAAGMERPAEASGLFAAAQEKMTAELGSAATPEVGGALTAMASGVVEGTLLVPLGARTILDLLLPVARRGPGGGRDAFRRRVRETGERLRALLEADAIRRPGKEGRGVLERSLGQAGTRFFDPAALAATAGTGSVGEPLPDALRGRVEEAAATLAEWLAGAEELPVLVHGGSLVWAEAAAHDGWRVVVDEDPCAAAARLFDEAAAAVADVVRAEQFARLELEGVYDAERHDPWLARLDWDAFDAETQSVLPVVVALVPSERLVGPALSSLSPLLLSGRPVQVIGVEGLTSPVPAEEPGTGMHFEPGYLGMSFREVWVQQTSAGRPFHMMEGFTSAIASGRPGLHVIASGFRPNGDEPRLGAWFFTGAALEGRAHPFFRYDPAQGNSWARRLDFSGNPQPEADWPVYPMTAKREGKDETLSLPFTYADFALLDPAWSGHFRLLAEGEDPAGLVTVDAYFELEPEEALAALPFVWGVDGTGRLRRLVVTRWLTLAARDRLGFWRTLQELAGVRNEYVEEAARRAREAAEAEARDAQTALESSHAEELERMRLTAAEEAVNRLTAALLEVDLSVFPAPGAGGFPALGGRDVDEVAAALLAAIDPDKLEAGEGPASETVERTAAELLQKIDPDRLEDDTK